MAKGARSNRKKALRTVRREKVRGRCAHNGARPFLCCRQSIPLRSSTPPCPAAPHHPLHASYNRSHSQVTATWKEAADQKRMAVLQACMDAEPVKLSEQEMARIEEAKAAPPRGRAGGPDAMDAEGAGASKGAAGKGKRRGGKKGLAVGGGKGGRKKQVGVLSALGGARW